jgi:hypothetical protein
VGAQTKRPSTTPKAKKVTPVVRPSQTEPSEETNMGVQERREVDAQTQGHQKHLRQRRGEYGVNRQDKRRKNNAKEKEPA